MNLDSIDALTTYARVSFSNDDLDSKISSPLVKLDQFDMSLHEYTQKFKSKTIMEVSAALELVVIEVILFVREREVSLRM